MATTTVFQRFPRHHFVLFWNHIPADYAPPDPYTVAISQADMVATFAPTAFDMATAETLIRPDAPLDFERLDLFAEPCDQPFNTPNDPNRVPAPFAYSCGAMDYDVFIANEAGSHDACTRELFQRLRAMGFNELYLKTRIFPRLNKDSAVWMGGETYRWNIARKLHNASAHVICRCRYLRELPPPYEEPKARRIDTAPPPPANDTPKQL